MRKNGINIYYLLLLIIVACGKGADIPVDESPPIENRPNGVTISGISDDDYVVAVNGRIIISPIVTRDTEQTYDDLTFEWIIDGNSVGKSKDLNITLPTNISNGKKKGRYNIYCTKTTKLYSKDFNITVLNPYGYGYYFISVDEAEKSLLSHINIDSNYDIVFHTSAIGNAEIGDNVHSLNAYPYYDLAVDKLKYKIFITSENGATPHIITESTTLTLLETISSSYNGISFTPKIHIIGHDFEKTSHFFSDRSYFLYENSVLSHKNNKYKFSYIIPGNNDRYLYTFDRSKGIFCVIDTEKEHTIVELNGDLSSKSIIGHRLSVRYENNQVKDEILILSVHDKKLSFYKIANNEIILEEVVDTESVVSCAVQIGKTTWALGVGNKIYQYDESKKMLTSYYTLNTTFGKVESIDISQNKEKLIITTYNESTNKLMKGSIVILDKNMVAKNYPNVIYRCKVIKCCDASRWEDVVSLDK